MKGLAGLLAGLAGAARRTDAEREVTHFLNEGKAGASWGLVTLLDTSEDHVECCGSMELIFRFVTTSGIATVCVLDTEVEAFAKSIRTWLADGLTISPGSPVVALVNADNHSHGARGGCLGLLSTKGSDLLWLYGFGTEGEDEGGAGVRATTGDIKLSRESAIRLAAVCEGWVERVRAFKAKRELDLVREGDKPAPNGTGHQH